MSKKSSRGLWNSITALILVIAAVAITLVVVIYAFSVMSSTNLHQVYVIGQGSLKESNGEIVANLTIISHANYIIVNASLNNQVNAIFISSTTLRPGNNTITFYFPSISLIPDHEYTIYIYLNNGEVILGSVVYQ
ncbi:MAG: DUF973 family protein [Sulfolobaceae archaeon]|nr:DUF973 family protein [Sulfolobaceae archaeon]